MKAKSVGVIVAAMLIVAAAGVIRAGIQGHSGEAASFTPADPPWVTAQASIIQGETGTYPNCQWAVQTPQNFTMKSADVFAADGTELDDKASNYGLSSDFRWQANVKFLLEGEVSLDQYAGPTVPPDPPTTYETHLFMSVGFKAWKGTGTQWFNDWNVGESKDIIIQNETTATQSDSVQKSVATDLANVDEIHVGFLHQFWGDASTDRAEPIVKGKGETGPADETGGWVKLWDESTTPPTRVKTWNLP